MSKAHVSLFGSGGDVLPIAGGGGGGAISAGATLAYGAIAAGSGSVNVTLTAGRAVVVIAWWEGTTSTITSISIAGNGNMVVQGSTATNAALPLSMQGATYTNLTAGGSRQVTVTLSGSNNGGFVVRELAGCNTTEAFDAAGSANNFGAAPSATVVTTVDNCHIVSALALNESAATTAGTGYTITDTTDDEWWNWFEEDTDFNVGAAGSKTVDYTSPAAQWLTVAIAVKP